MTNNSEFDTISKQFFAGAAAGFISELTVHPSDTIRARLQVQNKTQGEAYKNTFDAVIKTIKNEGIRGLYKGSAAVAVCSLPANGLYFGGYEFAKRAIQPSKKLEQKGPAVHFVSGLFAELCGAFVWNPMDVVKQKVQISEANNNRHSTSLAVTKLIYKEEGFKGFFKGFVPSLLTYGPFVGIYFVLYEQYKRSSCKYFGLNSEEELQSIWKLSGAFGCASLASAVTNPIDVVKTRIQTQDQFSKVVYKGSMDAFATILKTEGVPALFQGLLPRITWIAPGTAITIVLCKFTVL